MNPEQWERISELFHRGLQLSDAERDSLIASEVRDPEAGTQLRQLWLHAAATGFLQEPVLAVISGEIPQKIPSEVLKETELAADAASEGEGTQRIGKYRVVSVLGEGGMGVVYLGIQDKPIYRQVAIKLIKAGMNSRGILARFESERQTLALLDHPNVAQIHEADVGSDGRPYFVMEYVAGLPITEYCDRNLLGCKDRLLLFQQVCYAVQHAHQRGIIHRDLKPSNILIAVKDGKPVPKVIDFGVAKALNQRLQEEAAFTEFGMLVGTPEYMSPEQAEHSADVDTTSDVYSLGVVLYELLSGTLPFDSEALRRAGLAEIQRVIRESEPPRPTTRLSSLKERAADVAHKRHSDLPSLLRQLRGDLDWIVMKALEKDRTRRYSSASEFAADIGRNLTDQPVLAGPPSAIYTIRKFARRHRMEFAAAAILLIVIIAALITSTLLYIRAERARVLAEGQAYKASLAAARSSIEGFRSAEAREMLLKIPPSLRKWEWRYLYWLSDTSLAILNSGEGGANIHIGFTADGSRFFVATATSVHSWTLGSFVRTGDYGPFGRIISMSSDGSLVVAEMDDGKFKALQVAETLTGKTVCRLENQGSPLVDASFDAHSRRLVILARNNQAQVWDVRACRLITPIQTLRTPPSRVGHRDHEIVAVSPDGAVVARTEYSDIRLHAAVSGRSIALLRGNFGPVQSLSFSENGRRLIAASQAVSVWDVGTGKLISDSQFRRAFSIAVARPDGGPTAVAGWYHAVHFLDTSTGELMETVLTPTVQSLAAMAWSPQGKYLIGADFAGGVRIWNGPTLGSQNLQEIREDGGVPSDLTRPENGFDAMNLSADGSRIAVTAGPEIRVIDTYTGRRLSVLKNGESGSVRALALQPGTDTLASGSDDRTITIWTPDSPVPLRRLKGHEGAVTALAYSPNGALLISGSDDRTLCFWDAAAGKLRFTRKLAGKIHYLVISPDSSVVAVKLDPQSYATGEPPIELLDARTGKTSSQLEGINDFRSAGLPQDIAFSPDGTLLAASDGGVLGAALWDVRTGKQVRRLASVGRQGYAASGFAFSPDGQRLAGSFGGGSIAVWNPTDGELLLEMFADAKQLRFSPDSSRLYINSYYSIEVLDTRPVYPAEAEELLHSLEQRFTLLCDLRGFMQNGSVEPNLRNTVLRLISYRQESPRSVRELVDNVLNSNVGAAAAYEAALRRSSAISETYPWDQAALVRLGAALYRAKTYRSSLTALERAAPLDVPTVLRKQVFIAMANYRLGNFARGSELLDATRSRAKGTVLAQQDADAITALLREAESLHVNVTASGKFQ